MRVLAAGTLLVLLAGCGASEPPPPAPAQKTVFDPMLQQRDKVKEMAEKLPQQRTESLDKAIDGDAK